MTLTLILMRHAKSAWDDPAQDDIDRPLNERGRRQAPLVANWLAAEGLAPDLALVSRALRTQETWALLSERFPDTRAEVREDLYLASPRSIVSALSGVEGRTVLVLAHNPGMAEVARDLVRHAPDDGDFLRFPTAATAVLRFDADRWDEIGPGKGDLVAFTVPRRLEV